MGVLPQYFETLNTDGTYYWDDVALKWLAVADAPTLSLLHPTQGTHTWKIDSAALAAIGAGTGTGPTVVDLSAVNSLSVDVYVESIASGQAALFIVNNDDGSDTITTTTPTDGTGAYTLNLDLTTLSGTRADCSILVGVLAAAVIYIDNLRVPATGVTLDLAATEAPDTAAVTLTQSPGLSLAATEAQDTAAFVVTVGNTSVASLAATEAPDIAAIALTAATTASLAATEAPDTVSIVTVNQSATYPPITGGGYYREHKPQYRIHPEYEDAPPKKKRRKPEPDEQPFIIAPEPIVRKLGEIRPAWNTAAELMRSELEAAQAAKARAERIKAIVQADDEWLMTG